jgi:Domain of unknown function (DUF4282)
MTMGSVVDGRRSGVNQSPHASIAPDPSGSLWQRPEQRGRPQLTPAMSRCSLPAGAGRSGEDRGDRGGFMFGLGDLFQWERFVTPTVIKVFYWLAVVISILLGFAGVVSSLTTMAYNPFVGLIFLITSLLGTGMGIVMSRIAAEFVLIVFRINEHLGAIRNQGGFRQ